MPCCWATITAWTMRRTADRNTLETIRAAGLACTGAGEPSEAQKAIVKEFDVGGLPLKLAIISG